MIEHRKEPASAKETAAVKVSITPSGEVIEQIFQHIRAGNVSGNACRMCCIDRLKWQSKAATQKAENFEITGFRLKMDS